jgi:hypothetical protein
MRIGTEFAFSLVFANEENGGKKWRESGGKLSLKRRDRLPLC